MFQPQPTIQMSVFALNHTEAETPYLFDSRASLDCITLVFRTDEAHLFLAEGEEAVLGRTHPSNKFQPTVDLSKFGGVASGVSRIHASLHRKNNNWWLEDLGSSNGTWVNGERLCPYTLFQLNDNCQILLANLEIGFILPKTVKRAQAA